MNARTLSILLGLTVAAGAAAVLLSSDDAGRAPDAGAFLPGLADRVNDVTRVTLTTPEGTITAVRTDDDWTIEELDGYPADFEVVKQVVVGASDLAVVEPKTARPDRWSRLGLDAEGGVVLGFAVGDQDVGGLVVGDTRPGRPAALYARRPDEDQTWLVEGRLAPPRTPTGWVDREILSITADRWSRIVLSPHGSEPVVLERTDDGDAADAADAGGWTVADVPSGHEPADVAALRAPTSALAHLRFDDVRRRDHVPWDAAEVTRATYHAEDGLVVAVLLATHEERPWIALDVEATEDAGEDVVEEAAGWSASRGAWAFAIPSWKADALRAGPDDLLVAIEEAAPEEPAAEPAAESAAEEPVDGESSDSP